MLLFDGLINVPLLTREDQVTSSSHQFRRKTPSTARSSAGLISLECATVTANSGPGEVTCCQRIDYYDLLNVLVSGELRIMQTVLVRLDVLVMSKSSINAWHFGYVRPLILAFLIGI
jgi:hypothetical protein